jgi:hypothetical protein
MWPPMTLLILLLLSPCSLLFAYGAGSLPPGERVSALAASIVADQGMILPANDADDLAADAGEESTDDGLGPPFHLASRLAHEFWRAIRWKGLPDTHRLARGILIAANHSECGCLEPPTVWRGEF